MCKIIPPQPQFAHIRLLRPFLCRRISSTQQKRSSQQSKRAGQGRGVCHPFAKNSWQTPYPCFYLILPVSTTDKLIFESCVLVTYLTSAVALCLPPVLLCLYPSRLARESYLSLQIHIIALAAKQQHTAYIWLTIRLSNMLRHSRAHSTD